MRLGWIYLGLGAVVCQPIQLVRPLRDHARLEATQEGLKLLQSLEGPVAVVSAVGAVHSGKSFLLNQLVGANPRNPGFPVGYTIKPETSGIWVWSQPTKIQSNTTYILYLHGCIYMRISPLLYLHGCICMDISA